MWPLKWALILVVSFHILSFVPFSPPHQHLIHLFRLPTSTHNYLFRYPFLMRSICWDQFSILVGLSLSSWNTWGKMLLQFLFCSCFWKGKVKGLSAGDGFLVSESWGNKGHPHGKRRNECKAMKKFVGPYSCETIIRSTWPVGLTVEELSQFLIDLESPSPL